VIVYTLTLSVLNEIHVQGGIDGRGGSLWIYIVFVDYWLMLNRAEGRNDRSCRTYARLLRDLHCVTKKRNLHIYANTGEREGKIVRHLKISTFFNFCYHIQEFLLCLNLFNFVHDRILRKEICEDECCRMSSADIRQDD
jgi:hypothetical protein